MKKKILYSIIQLVPLILLYLLSNSFFKDMYLFEWTARNSYCYIWIIIILLTFANKIIYAISLGIANILGIVAGQFVGDWINIQNIQKITPYMGEEEKYHLQSHPGFNIWFYTILSIMILTFIIKKYIKKDI
jgi:hypothetical protein